MPPTADADRFAIRELVENWALWRDAGDWERFATVWHPTEGWMTATWFQGPAPDFIAAGPPGVRLRRQHPALRPRSCVAGPVPGRLPAPGLPPDHYLQTKAGFTVKAGLPGLTGEAVMRLYDEGARWLVGSPSPGEPR